ncbi:MAG: AAA family ATPase [Verrucomicrobiaceae bacterium]|nr:AAA family ATPase [Verrucomicrobiaceae bacterium]
MSANNYISEDQLRSHHFLDYLDEKETFTLNETVKPLRHLELQMQQSEDGNRRGLVGMQKFIRSMLIALILGEHLLVEGVPGLAKTYAVKLLSSLLGLVWRRIQNTPDLMPSDLLYKEKLEIDENGRQNIAWYPGPIFTTLLLSDEINRATPKTQAAMLELMEERQVSIIGRGRLPARPMPSVHDDQLIDEAQLILECEPFYGFRKLRVSEKDDIRLTVFATQNPIEQEGTYTLPEAQGDRFLLKSIVNIPERQHLQALAMHAAVQEPDEHYLEDDALMTQAVPNRAQEDREQKHLKTLYFLVKLKSMLLSQARISNFMQTPVARGILDLWECTHNTTGKLSEGQMAFRERVERAAADEPHLVAYRTLTQTELDNYRLPRLAMGASPRGLLGLIRAAHAQALLEDSFDRSTNELVVKWEHVRTIAPDVLRHRIKLDPGEEASFDADDYLKRLLGCFDHATFD